MKLVKKIFLCLAVLMVFEALFTATAYALDEGVYTMGRETSYVNPETGSTADGGTNIALGDSMCASIVEDHLLVEKTDSGIYVTIGLGLMSNIENVRIKVQNANGDYYDADITLTGNCERDGDTCNHYRFEVPSADSRISPVIYVAPMGRDVQFFVTPDVSTAKKGTGNFVSEMITEKATQNTTEVTKKETTTTVTTTATKPIETTVTEKTTVAVDNKTDNIKSDSDNSNNAVRIICGIAAVLCAGVCICLVKKKKGSVNKKGDTDNEM